MELVANTLYQQLIGPSATSWPMSDVGHMEGLQTRPEEYERRVLDFFEGPSSTALPLPGQVRDMAVLGTTQGDWPRE